MTRNGPAFQAGGNEADLMKELEKLKQLAGAVSPQQQMDMMKELGLVDRLPRLVVAQAENANPLYRAVQREGRATPDVRGDAIPARTTLAPR